MDIDERVANHTYTTELWLITIAVCIATLTHLTSGSLLQTCPVKCGIKLLIHSQTSTAQLVKFWNR